MGDIGVPPALQDAVESLKEAIIAGRTDIFRKILEACENCDGGGKEEKIQLINSISIDGGTYLHMATKLGHGDLVRALLASGADPGVQNKNGHTAMEVASSPSISGIFVEELLKAAAQSRTGRVCQLIAAGLSVNSYDNPLSHNTPLHWAASFGDVDTIHCLLERGADVNAQNSNGVTPLHDAVARGSKDIVWALLESGADPHVKSLNGCYKGLSPAMMAAGKDVLKDHFSSYITNKDFNKNEIVANGSISPILKRKTFSQEEIARISARANSLESLTSIGCDSIVISNIPNGDISKKSDVVKSEKGRMSPLNSSSSLDFSPKMEQVCERLAAMHLKMPVRQLITNGSLNQLWPQPKRITKLECVGWEPPHTAFLEIVNGTVSVHKILDIWKIHKKKLFEVGIDVTLSGIVGCRESPKANYSILCVVDSRLLSQIDEYVLTIKEDKVSLLCSSLPSLHCALVTLVQLIQIFTCCKEDTQSRDNVCIPAMIISDYPSLKYRGFMLDVAPMARIPTFDNICHFVDILAGMKINQLHLMLRLTTPDTHSCQTSFHSVCKLPYTSSELVILEEFCKNRGIQLIPCFDIDATTSPPDLGSVFCAVATAVNSFPSAKIVHIGPGLSAILADANSENELVENSSSCSPWLQLGLPSNVIMMLCANIFHGNLSALQRLPPATILIEYGFQADYDFSQGTKLALEEGWPLALCPGTAAWSSLSGWPEAGVSNVYLAVSSAVDAGATGVIVAHWSSTASLTPFAFAWPPLLIAAGVSWNNKTHWDFLHSSLGSLIDIHLAKQPSCGLGPALLELGRCETWVTRVMRRQSSSDPSDLPSSNPGSVLYQLLSDPDNVIVMRHIRQIAKSSMKLGECSGIGVSPWSLANLTSLEVQLSIDMILTASRLGRALVTVGTNPNNSMGLAVMNPGIANLPPTVRTDLANKPQKVNDLFCKEYKLYIIKEFVCDNYTTCIGLQVDGVVDLSFITLRELYSSVWHEGYQATGLQSSLFILTSLLARLLPDKDLYSL